MGIEYFTRNHHRTTHTRRLLRALAAITVISLTAALCGLLILLAAFAFLRSHGATTEALSGYPWRVKPPAAPAVPAPPAPPTSPVGEDLALFRRSLIGTGAFALALATSGIAIVGWRRRQW